MEAVEAPYCCECLEGFFGCHALAASFSFKCFAWYGGFYASVLVAGRSDLVSLYYDFVLVELDGLVFHLFHIFLLKNLKYLLIQKEIIHKKSQPAKCLI